MNTAQAQAAIVAKARSPLPSFHPGPGLDERPPRAHGGTSKWRCVAVA
jgi:hypothetical protein